MVKSPVLPTVLLRERFRNRGRRDRRIDSAVVGYLPSPSPHLRCELSHGTCMALFVNDRCEPFVSISHPCLPSSRNRHPFSPDDSPAQEEKYPPLLPSDMPESTSHPFIQPLLFFVPQRRGGSTLKVHRPSVDSRSSHGHPVCLFLRASSRRDSRAGHDEISRGG